MMTLKGGLIYKEGKLIYQDIVIEGDKIIAIADDLNQGEIIDCHGLLIAPSFMDPHVHFREPGFTYKETIKTGSMAACRGGYTHVFMMPNLNPVPDSVETFKLIHDIIKRDSPIHLTQLASITVGQKGTGKLVDFESLAPYTYGFSDDGRGIDQTKDMYEAMMQAKKINRAIIAHCEDMDLVNNGYIRKGKYSERNHHRGILDIAETVQLARDLVLALETKCHYHVCHVSTKQSVDLIRFYKKLGAHVTAEVSPHHLLLTEDDLKEDGNYKMNPPLGSITDKKALIDGLLDGTIDCIATDHAPHASHEKNIGLEKALFGIVGLETSFPLLYHHFVLKQQFSLEFLLDKMSGDVARIFNMPKNKIAVNSDANLVVINLHKTYKIDEEEFLSKGKNQPFSGMDVTSKIMKTIYKGRIVYDETEISA